MTLAKFLTGFDSGFSPESVVRLARDTSEVVALRIINQFRLTLESSLQKIAEHSPNDWEVLSVTCHKLAGSAELVGFFRLGQNCRIVMNGSKSGIHGGLKAILEEIQDEGLRILSQLELNCPDLKSFV